jgi:hypothetical protein
MPLVRRLHAAILAFFVFHFRTRAIVRTLRAAHAAELRETPVQNWPMLQAKQRAEIAAIRAGKLETVDRKSWQWPFLPASVQRMSVPIIKVTPYNLRRMSRTPVPRRAINLIKNSVISLKWDIRAIKDEKPVDSPDEQKERIRILKKTLRHPNNQDSWQSLMEMSIEDILIFGAFSTEMGITLDPERPVKLWAVNVESIRIFPAWTEANADDFPHYAQMTGLKGERGAIIFFDDELMYIKDNPSTDTPFGLGKMEVAFTSVNDFLGVQSMSGKAGVDQVHKTWLWWENPQSDSAYQIVRRHIQNDLEGQAKVSLIGGMKKPEVIEITPVLEQDLLLNWQELLIRMIANAFDLSAMSLGVEHDVNRAVGQVLDDKDFRAAVVPMARRIEEAITRRVIHKMLGWYDLEFAFLNLDDADRVTQMDICAQMYSCNAITPEGICERLGAEPPNTPFAKMTQVEAMLVTQEATQKMQEAMQQRQAEQQKQDQMDQMDQQTKLAKEQGLQQTRRLDKAGVPAAPSNVPNGIPGKPQLPMQQPGMPGMQPGMGAPKPPAAAKPKQLTAPKPIKLPKFPIAGSQWSAAEIAKMQPKDVDQKIKDKKLPAAPKLMKEMTKQEPLIIEEMSEALAAYFDKQLEQEQKDNTNKLRPKVIEKWRKELQKKYSAQKRKDMDYTEWVTKKAKKEKPGTPGKIGKPGRLGTKAWPL